MSKMGKEQLVYGLHTVLALLQKAPDRIATLYLQQGRADRRTREILQLAEKSQVACQSMPRQMLDELVAGASHQGVVACCHTSVHYTEADIESFLTNLTEPAFLLILDQIQDPHNLGACLRTANAAGVHMVIAPKDRSVGITATVRKVASGAAESLPFIQVTNLARTLRKLRDQGIWIAGMAGEASQSLYKADLRGPIALVLGAEEKGLRQLTREHCDYLLYIPMLGAVSSLNVSVATGVCLFEAVRQRNE